MGHENGAGAPPKKVAIYCRVSTSDQDNARQERDLLEHAERAGALGTRALLAVDDGLRLSLAL